MLEESKPSWNKWELYMQKTAQLKCELSNSLLDFSKLNIFNQMYYFSFVMEEFRWNDLQMTENDPLWPFKFMKTTFFIILRNKNWVLADP